ncbi:sensor domain-containing diguanylate cyclase/phosphohydrolase [Natranaerobius thermophilus]|uniref:Diguanylate cyclase and metal dependent phosphohydrolase n=1 Tax=Natranaerobius thermophilus (strain ATCC BAA-1301 / DSM 18059 / JW/NM-WN-LF) TaxID=457570 RepID=B2A174_NATTJ|nr:PAS domain S-box protein [Natranaerobius thermophilus]ACB86015.1 diguanylate cyclase and metal dependent phosphohydrolase [Natranaerobius thermophilus JW/NM-WN-LF]
MNDLKSDVNRITDHINKELKVKEQAINSSINAIAFTDLEGYITYVNQSFLDLWGYEEEQEILGRSALEFWKNIDKTQKILDELFEKGTWVGELIARKKDGELFDVHLSASLVEDEQGKPLKLVGSFIDISKQKRAEDKLLREKARYQALIEEQLELVCRWLPDTTLTFVNKSYCNFFGQTKHDLLGKKWIEFVPEQERDKVWQKYQNLTNNPRVLSYEHQVTGADGKAYWQHWIDCPIFNDMGELVEFQSVARDVTVRRNKDEKIQYLSFHDSLTGLYNRAYLEGELTRLDGETRKGSSSYFPISVIMADLNGLKMINDSYGHHVGDEMLLKVAQILHESCDESSRKKAEIARWGGDEFVILLPDITDEEARDICKVINYKCKGTYVKNIPLSLAVGTATKESIQEDMMEVLTRAENDMYKLKLAESRSARSDVVNALLKALEAKSFETESHARRMLMMAREIGKQIGLSHSELNRLNLLITLHDIGKINIPEEVLTKNGTLNEDEWTIMKKHPEIGYRIAIATEEFAHVAEEILSHHEHWDGSGYPRGLSGEEIPLLARIAAIADAYEVMSNGRPYKEPMGEKEIVAEFKRCAGTQFDPKLVEIFLELLRGGNINE